ncbi:MAG: dehydrogenase [Candidatus Marinimicrobia bacterium]|nr:dehydrogenase [Candidatus Neomarinimicrobiota bacterium]
MTNKFLLNMYEKLIIPRIIEEKMLLSLRKGKISKWFSGIGQEAISVGSTLALDKNDSIFPMHRNLGVFTTREVDLKSLFCQLIGKKGGFTKGRDRSFHFGLPEKNIIGMISHLAAMLPVANGYGLSYKLKNKKNVALAYIGDGATSEGDFHEALNLASVWNLPVIFLIENNGYGLSTPVVEQFKCKKLSDRAVGYGIKGETINGNDIIEVYNAIKIAVKRAKQNKGPTLIEAMTFRMRGHEEASGTKYIDNKHFEKWKKKDPIKLFEFYLKKNKIIDKKYIKNKHSEIGSEVDLALEYAFDADKQTSTIVIESNDVFCKSHFNKIEFSSDTKEMRLVDAVSNCLEQKMESDENVLIMGQDIAEYGGVFKITEGFVEKFGKERVRNTPIIESGIIGAAMGLSLNGFKPIVEMQFSDFVSCGFNQIVNNIAKNHYRWNYPVNVTIRMPSGGNVAAGPFHSQSSEAWFLHVPGIKIVYPAFPDDAKGLLNSSIDDPNPVLFFEHKALYRSIKNQVPQNLYNLEIGKGKIRKKGNDLTIISYGLAVHWALEKAMKLKDDIDVEVVDLISIYPYDKDIISKSVKKTNRVMILHEANLTGGVGAEISAFINEELFEYLDAPVTRLASLDTPVPFSSNLEKEIYFPLNRIENKIEKIIKY